MKIAFFVGMFPSLSESFILDQITFLIARGHEVDIYADKPKKITKTHPEIAKYNLLEHTYFYPTIPNNHILRLIKAIWLFIANFVRDSQLLCRAIDVRKYSREAKSLRLLYTIIPFLKRRPKYDIIQCHFGMNGNKAIALRNMQAIEGKICTTFHGLDISKKLREFDDKYYECLFKQGDCFLPISDYWQQKLIDLGCDRSKITVHRMGIDCHQFVPTKRHFCSDRLKLTSIARLVEKKGIEYGIRAVAHLKKNHPKLEYRIVGDGELRADLENLIHELDVEDVVKLLGWQQRQEVIEILKNTDLLLTPSVTSKDGDCEGIPVVIMESMAMKIPVISTWHSGIPELIEDNISGFLVPERDSNALADSINYLLENQELLFEIRENSRLQVEKKYNVTQQNFKLLEIYQQLLDIKL